MNGVYSMTILRAALDAIMTDAATWSAVTGTTLRMFINDFQPLPTSVVADFTEPTFTGYTPPNVSAAVWSTPATFDGLGNALIESTTLYNFVATTVTDPAETVYGWFVTNTAGDEVYAAGRLENPFTFAQVGDGFLFKLALRLLTGGITDWDGP